MQMRNPNPPRQGLSGPVRLAIVAGGLAIGAWLLVPLYVESFGEIRQQFRNAAAPKGFLPGRRVVGCNSPYAYCQEGVR